MISDQKSQAPEEKKQANGQQGTDKPVNSPVWVYGVNEEGYKGQCPGNTQYPIDNIYHKTIIYQLIVRAQNRINKLPVFIGQRPFSLQNKVKLRIGYAGLTGQPGLLLAV